MARWDEEGRWGAQEEWTRGRRDEWRGADRLGGRGPSDRGPERDDWRRDTWRGSERDASDRGDEWRREEEPAYGASGRDVPAYRGPYRSGDDYGAREYGATEGGRGWRGAAEMSRREGRYDPGDRDERGRRSRRAGSAWGGGDYTTYGQSGFEESDRAQRMNQDLHREQGRGRHGAEHGPRWSGGDERWSSASRDRGPLQRAEDRLREGLARFTGRGPKGYKRTDERIREDVCERIARSGINAEEVEVRVEHAEVTLSGTAETRHDKRILEDLADEVFGVEEVHNHLRMNRDRGTADDTGTAAGTAPAAQPPQPGQRPQPPGTQPGVRH